MGENRDKNLKNSKKYANVWIKIDSRETKIGIKTTEE